MTTKYMMQTIQVSDAEGFAVLPEPDREKYGPGWYIQGPVTVALRAPDYAQGRYGDHHTHLAVVTWVQHAEGEQSETDWEPELPVPPAST